MRRPALPRWSLHKRCTPSGILRLTSSLPHSFPSLLGHSPPHSGLCFPCCCQTVIINGDSPSLQLHASLLTFIPAFPYAGPHRTAPLTGTSSMRLHDFGNARVDAKPLVPLRCTFNTRPNVHIPLHLLLPSIGETSSLRRPHKSRCSVYTPIQPCQGLDALQLSECVPVRPNAT